MTLTRVTYLAFLTACVALVTGEAVPHAPGQVSGRPQRRLNVLLITGDDLGIQLAMYGDSSAKTPNLKRLAESGVLFRVAYVTQASCSPSRSSIFTGLFPHANGQYGLTSTGTALHPKLHSVTIPALLRQGGYRTGLIGKLHVAPEEVFPFDFRPAVNTRVVREVARLAATFLDDVGSNPFFLMVSYADPHASTDSKERGRFGFPPSVDGLPEVVGGPTAASILPFQQIDSPKQRTRVANYYNSVERLDAGVGMLLDELEVRGLRDSTLVIFLGDHGPPFARAKITVYEAGVRVPFMVRWPGISRPMVSSAMVSSVDILPTILDAANLTVPAGLHGRSLRPVLEDSVAEWRSHVATEFHLHGDDSFYPRRAIRDQRFKVIHNLMSGARKPANRIDGDRAYRESRKSRYRGTSVRNAFDTFADPPEFELYDLDTDPFELENLAGRTEYRNKENELAMALEAWRIETNDPFRNAAFLNEMARNYPLRRSPWGAGLIALLAGVVVWRISGRRLWRIGR